MNMTAHCTWLSCLLLVTYKIRLFEEVSKVSNTALGIHSVDKSIKTYSYFTIKTYFLNNQSEMWESL